MQIVYQMGAHGTDGDRMLKTLLNNRVWLLRNGAEVVTPNRHRGVFEEALAALKGGVSTPEMEQIMLDSVLDSDAPQRVIFSTPSFLGGPPRAVGIDGIYPQAGARIAALANLFPGADCEFFLALKNPATMIAELLPLIAASGREAFLSGIDPDRLDWRATVVRMAQGAQGRRLVLWCHEDVPMVWPEVVRTIGAMPADVPLAGGLVYLHEMIGDEGLRALRADLSGREVTSIAARRALHAEHIRRHVKPEALEQEIAIPGWTQEVVDRITARYRQDVAQIAVMPGVEFLTP